MFHQKILFFIFTQFLLLGLVPFAHAETGTIDATNNTAKVYSDGSSVNFLPTGGAAPIMITDEEVTGYAWGENIGWINFSPNGESVVNSCGGALSGYAYGSTAGWVNFGPFENSATPEVVISTSTGDWSGFAWSATFGWIQFDCGVVGACVSTDWRPDADCGDDGGTGGGGSKPSTPIYDQCPGVSGFQITNTLCAPPIDHCPNLVGIQTSPSFCPLPIDKGIDKCPNISGIQTSAASCPVTPDDSGDSSDVCPEVSGVQTSTVDCPSSIDDGDESDPTIPGNTDPDATGDDPTPSITEFFNTVVEVVTSASDIVASFLSDVFLSDVPPGLIGALALVTALAGGIFASSLASFFVPSQIGSLALFLIGVRIRLWGVVYDSELKEPLDPVYVTLFGAHGEEVNTAITDLSGRYGFLVKRGLYRLTATHSNYRFPSSLLAGKKNDGYYDDLYFGADMTVSDNVKVIIKNIPMDPTRTRPDFNVTEKINQRLVVFRVSRIKRSLALILHILFWIGFGLSTITAFAYPTFLNLALFALYILIYLISLRAGSIMSPYGIVIDKNTKAPISRALIKIFKAELHTEIGHKKTDTEGVYYALVPKGRYYVEISELDQSDAVMRTFTSAPFMVRRGCINRAFEI